MTDVRLQVLGAMLVSDRNIVIVVARVLSSQPVGDCIGLALRSEGEWDEWHTEEFRAFGVKPLERADERRLHFRPVGKARQINEGEIFTTVAEPDLNAV